MNGAEQGVVTEEHIQLVRRLRHDRLSLAQISRIYDSLDMEEGWRESVERDEDGEESPPMKTPRLEPAQPTSPASSPALHSTPPPVLSSTPVLLSHLLGPTKTAVADMQRDLLLGQRGPGLVGVRPGLPFPFSHLPAHLGAPEPSAYRPLRPDMDFSTTDHPEELRHLLKNGEEEAIGEMKSFVSQYQLRQTAVAAMSGVSQPYISKFLNGNYKELSQRVRTILFNWYLGARKSPETMMVRVKTEGEGRLSELLPQRRERYVFRPSLIRILEAHFAHHAYPDLHRRMEIAAECNRALEAEKQGALLTKELVSPQVIANWFANKRKELKRRVGESLVEGSILPSPLMKVGEPGISDTAESASVSPQLPPHFPIPGSGGVGSERMLKTLQSELEAVNSSVLALINPYGEDEPHS